MAQMVIYLDDKLKQTVEQVAQQEERSVSYLVRTWIKEKVVGQAALSLATPENKDISHNSSSK